MCESLKTTFDFESCNILKIKKNIEMDEDGELLICWQCCVRRK